MLGDRWKIFLIITSLANMLTSFIFKDEATDTDKTSFRNDYGIKAILDLRTK